MEVLWFFFGGGVCVGQPKSQLCFAKGRELKGLLGAMAEQLQPRRNFARVEEGKKGKALGWKNSRAPAPAQPGSLGDPGHQPSVGGRALSLPTTIPMSPIPFPAFPKHHLLLPTHGDGFCSKSCGFTGVTAWSRRGYGCWHLQILPGEWVPVRSTGCHAGTGRPLTGLGCSSPARMLSPAHSSRGIRTYFHPGLQIQR